MSFKNIFAPIPDSSSSCVIWFIKGVKGHQQKFFSGSELREAFDFADNLMLDDKNHGIHIIAHQNYYFNERIIKS